MSRRILLVIAAVLLLVPAVSGQQLLKLSGVQQIPHDGNPLFDTLRGEIVYPQVCPHDENLISFELRSSDGYRLFLYDMRYERLRELAPLKEEAESEIEFDLDAFGQDFKFYAAEFDWMPVRSADGDYVCAFSYSPGGTETDIYLYFYNADKYVKMTDKDIESTNYKDSHPVWSPNGRHIAFESDRTGNGDLFLLTRVDLFLKDQAKYPAGLYQLPGNPEYPDFGLTWNPNEASGLVAFTTKIPVGITRKNFYKIRIWSLADSQYVDVNPAMEEDNFQPSWDPYYGNMVAYFVGTYQRDLALRGKDTDKKLKINVRRVFQNIRLTPSDSAVSTLGSLGGNVSYDGRNGPVWLKNSDFLLFSRISSKGEYPLFYGDVKIWADDAGRYMGDLSSSAGYTAAEHVTLTGNRVVFKQQEGNRHYIIVSDLDGDYAYLPEKPEYKMLGHNRYADFLESTGPIPPKSIWTKAVDPVGGADFVINRPVVAVGAGALIFLLTSGGGDDGPPERPTFNWNPPAPPIP